MELEPWEVWTLKDLARREFIKTCKYAELSKQAQDIVFEHAGEEGWGVILDPSSERPFMLTDAEGYNKHLQQEYDRLFREWNESLAKGDERCSHGCASWSGRCAWTAGTACTAAP